jgi:hypothetical protein
MAKQLIRQSVQNWDSTLVLPGEVCDLTLAVSESYSGMTVETPIQVRRALEDGPTVFISGALHGDELNGTGTIRQLIREDDLSLLKGNLILIPVLNLLAFDRHSRYLPDRRDLNRCFPGSKDGTLASRMARTLFDEIVGRSDFGIDLHTAAVRRTNYPTVRGDLSNAKVARLAQAFGSEIILNSKGPKGSLRKEATAMGCPTVVMEGGEVWKVEPTIVEAGVRGIKNILVELGMLQGTLEPPAQQITLKTTKWVRAERGGFLEFHVKPGELVDKEQPLATNTDLLGGDASTLLSPFKGVVIGMTTLPAVSPGEPVCHIGKLPKGTKSSQIEASRSDNEGLEERIVENLASNIMVVEPVEQIELEDESE